MPDNLIIKSINEMDDETWGALYWSNEWGWVGIEEATKFTEEDAGVFLNLPYGGEWVYESIELGVDIPTSEDID
tara:strand:+ start:415 stop:636 length:222 start_codon:yes stop_codon:yes gene_type:complete